MILSLENCVYTQKYKDSSRQQATDKDVDDDGQDDPQDVFPSMDEEIQEKSSRAMISSITGMVVSIQAGAAEQGRGHNEGSQ